MSGLSRGAAHRIKWETDKYYEKRKKAKKVAKAKKAIPYPEVQPIQLPDKQTQDMERKVEIYAAVVLVVIVGLIGVAIFV